MAKISSKYIVIFVASFIPAVLLSYIPKRTIECSPNMGLCLDCYCGWTAGRGWPFEWSSLEGGGLAFIRFNIINLVLDISLLTIAIFVLLSAFIKLTSLLKRRG